ncbi:MAG: hypothetical protein JWM80_1077 [Cyanobacteria bacterium RYN_339]|nr:hypothetical protein [Cyanobacteria bacterium RYN_339]
MAIDNLSLSPIRLQSATPAAASLTANNAAAPTIGADSLKLGNTPVSLLANANSVAAANTVGTVGNAAGKLAAPAGSYTVKPNDTLSGIAKDQLGDATRWPEIFELNQATITDPNLIFPGQVVQLPGAKPATATVDTTPIDTTPVDVTATDDEETTDDGPTTADLPTPASAPAPSVIRQPIPRDFPPYGHPIPRDFPPYGHPPRCFPLPGTQHHDSRSEMLRQKLELLKMEEQVVRLELELDRMLKQLDGPRPIFKSASPIVQ